MRYGGSNPPLCTIRFFAGAGSGFRRREIGMNLEPAGEGRMVIALVVLALMAVLAWQTMEAGKFRDVVWLVFGFFAFRVILTRVRSR